MNALDLRADEPVLVLTCGRSGSTLLRFILDAHPKLACPPETRIADLCAQMGTTWKLLEGPAAAARPGLSGLATKSVRNWVTTAFGTYLIQAGKSRWCEKSIGAADSAGRFLTLFPKTRFICLYRDCLDVIDSVLEACPFGLRGYGLEQFAAAHVGNSVAAVADYWATHTRSIIEFEKQHPAQCVRIRYEDLVADPDAESTRIFTFLGEEPVPGIAGGSLVRGRAPFGPSDHKVWTTTGISGDSVGRGARLPVQAIPAGVRALLDHLLEQLDYPRLAAGPGRSPRPGSGSPAADVAVGELEELLAQRVTGEPGSASQLPPADDFSVTVMLPPGPPGSAASRTWRIDPGRRTMERVDARLGAATSWEIIGDMDAWTSVLTGQANLATLMRHGHLRYSDVPETAPGEPQFDDRVPLLAAMLLPAPERAGAAGPVA